MSYDFLCEDKLFRLAPELRKRYSDSLFASVNILTSYRAIFPDYTDHSYLHTMNVINYCNQLIGDNIRRMNCGEIYTLMMAAELHDTGMGVSDEDYRNFISEERFADYLEKNGSAPREEIIRDLHHELSGCFIRKYGALFEIPDEFIFPIVQAARGHRRTDLFDESEYPTDYQAGEYTICLPYIAALIRLADELDITAERNISLDRSRSEIKNSYSLSVWKVHSAVKGIVLTENSCTVLADGQSLSPDEREELLKWLGKLERVIGYTSDVVQSRTEFELTKRTVTLEYIS